MKTAPAEVSVEANTYYVGKGKHYFYGDMMELADIRDLPINSERII